jgi:hypothetical protein
MVTAQNGALTQGLRGTGLHSQGSTLWLWSRYLERGHLWPSWVLRSLGRGGSSRPAGGWAGTLSSVPGKTHMGGASPYAFLKTVFYKSETL